MSTNTTYSCKVSNKFVIDNGIIKGVEVPVKIDYDNYGDLILKKLEENPKFIGQIDGATGQEMTFGEMREKSVKCAIWLKEHNVKLGDVIGICAHNQMNAFVPCFASLYVGAAWNAWWDTGLTKDLAKHFLGVTNPKFVFVTERTADIVLETIKESNSDAKIIVFGKYKNFLSLDDILNVENSEKVSEFRCTKLRSREDPAMITYTSGSTGLPKGVVYSHRSVHYSIDYMKKLGPRENPVTLIFSPLSWITGFFFMFRAPIMPDRRIIYPVFEEEKCLQLIEKFKVNYVFLASGPAFRLAKAEVARKYDTSTMKFCYVGGSALKSEAQNALRQAFPHSTIIQMYGTTELGGMGLIQDEEVRLGSCGRVVQNVTIKVIDPESGRILGPHETGEICFKAPYLTSGYFNNPEASRGIFDSEGWLHTGDLMYYDEQGHFFFIDRLKELIKYKGQHVSPTMIEQLLQTHPEIHEVAVVSIPDAADDEVPIAFVAKKPGAKVTEDEIKKMVADSLPDYMQLRGGVKFLDELPHTSSNKVSRLDLKKLAKSYVS